MGLGCPCAVLDEEYVFIPAYICLPHLPSSNDLPMPTNCDDEYWEHEDPYQAFVQPHGKPTTIAAFIHLLKLYRLLAMALRNLVCVSVCSVAVHSSQPQFSMGMRRGFSGPSGEIWEKKVTRDLTDALEEWQKAVPDHRPFIISLCQEYF